MPQHFVGDHLGLYFKRGPQLSARTLGGDLGTGQRDRRRHGEDCWESPSFRIGASQGYADSERDLRAYPRGAYPD